MKISDVLNDYWAEMRMFPANVCVFHCDSHTHFILFTSNLLLLSFSHVRFLYFLFAGYDLHVAKYGNRHIPLLKDVDAHVFLLVDWHCKSASSSKQKNRVSSNEILNFSFLYVEFIGALTTREILSIFASLMQFL